MLPQRVYAKIDLDAICRNIKNAMDKVGKETKVMAIIKTDAYGLYPKSAVMHSALRPPRKQWFYVKTASKTPYLFWVMFFRRIMTTL